MKLSNIKYYCTTNGDGFRTAVFVSGCSIHCEGCFNKAAWNFNHGFDLTEDIVDKIMESIDHEYIDGLSILGGEPMDIHNQEGVHSLIKELRKRFGNTKDIWMWSGYYKDNMPETKFKSDILDNIDYLVDGPFEKCNADIKLRYRGSSNQHVIDMKKCM